MFIYNSFIDSFLVNYLISNIASTLVGIIAIASLNIGGVKKENKKIQIVIALISLTLLNFLSFVFSIATLILIYMFREDFFNNKQTNINFKKKSEILNKEKENLWYKISKDRLLLKHIESDERLKKEIKLEYLKLKKDKTEDLLKHHFEIEEIKSS
jgi:chromate transport protein ChrA